VSAPARNCVLAALFTTSAVTLAQTQQQPTFRTGVQLIEVDVRVFDKDGRFVTDLTKDDFEVLEQGVPQHLDAMYLVNGGQTGVKPGSDRGQTGVKPGSDQGQTTPAAAQTWIFLFDLNHLTPGAGFDRARLAVETFIAERFKDGDLAGILAGDMMINNRLTSVRQELLDAVRQVKPRTDSRSRTMEMTREWPRLLNEEEAIRIARNEREAVQRAITRACSDDQDQCRFAESAVGEKGRRIASETQGATMKTLSAVNGLASGLSKLPGPKTIVLLSDGFAVMDIETSLRSVVGQSARAGARIYAIDVRGLNRNSPGGSIEQLQATDEAGPVTKFDGLADGPNSLAVDTGGLMIRNENNLGRALDRISDDAGRYYVLAYQPANTTFDGKYRPIEVKVKRADLRVRARRGYLALEPAKMLKPRRITTPTDPVKPQPNPTTPDAAPPTAAAVETAPEPKPSPVSGAVVKESTPPAEGTVRLRPDSEARVKALSSREASPAGELVSRGWDAYQRGDVETALTAFTQATERGDVRPWVLYAMGLSHAALGHAADAASAWERVRQAAPDFEPVYMDLADTYAQMGDLTRALGSLREAEKRWPANGDVQSGIGVIHVRRGALDEGIVALTKAATAKPDDALAHLNLGRAYELRFHRSRRFVASQRRWVSTEEDRTKAAQAYERCIKLGGPYAQKAAEALSMLEWGKTGDEGSATR
jgi:VWFA-related protein